MSSFNPLRRHSKISRRASKDDDTPTDEDLSESQTEAPFPPHPSYPPTIATLITALQASLLATPAPNRIAHIDTVQKLLHTLSLSLASTPTSPSTCTTTDFISSPAFQHTAYKYLTSGHKTDNLSLAFIRESTCTFCVNLDGNKKENAETSSGSSSSSNPRAKFGDKEHKRALVLSEVEWQLVEIEVWRRGMECWCGGVQKRKKEEEKEKRRNQMLREGSFMREEVVRGRREREDVREGMNGHVNRHTNADRGEDGDAKEEEAQDLQRRKSTPTTPTPVTPSQSQSAIAAPNPSPTHPASRPTQRPTPFPVPRQYALKPYEWEQKPGLDGYSADQEREERFGEEYARHISELQEREERTRERQLEMERGRARERTGYGVPYNNNRMNSIGYGTGTTPYSDHNNPYSGVPLPLSMFGPRGGLNGIDSPSYNGNRTSRDPMRSTDRYTGTATGTGTSSYISSSRSASYAGTGTGTGPIAPAPPRSRANSSSSPSSSSNHITWLGSRIESRDGANGSSS